MTHRESHEPGGYLPRPAPAVDEALEPLVRAWGDGPSVWLPPYPYSPPEAETLFNQVAATLSTDRLIELIAQPSRTLRVRIVEEVMRRAPQRLDSLYPLLDDDRNVRVQRGCSISFERVGTLVLLHAVYHCNSSTVTGGRQAADLRALGRSFIELAAHDGSLPPHVRAEAIHRLSAFSPVPLSLVRDCLSSDAPPLLAAALRFRSMLPEQERERAVRGLLDHRSAWVRHEAFSAASAMRLAGLGPVRRRMMLSDPDEDCRALAAGAFARQCRRANPDLLALARDPLGRVRQIALERLVQIDRAAAVSVLEGLLGDADAVERALAQLEPRSAR